MKKCERCKGEKWVPANPAYPERSKYKWGEKPCPVCHGEGEVPDKEDER